MPISAVFFSDPNCPFCYATGERLHSLKLDDLVQWRGVQHAPHLPTPMKRAEGALAREPPNEVRAIQRRTPEVPISVPAGKPNTQLAITYAVAALQHDVKRGRAFIRSIYRAFWQRGADISTTAVLAKLATDCGAPRRGRARRRRPRDRSRLAAVLETHWARRGAATRTDRRPHSPRARRLRATARLSHPTSGARGDPLTSSPSAREIRKPSRRSMRIDRLSVAL